MTTDYYCAHSYTCHLASLITVAELVKCPVRGVHGAFQPPTPISQMWRCRRLILIPNDSPM